jgi:hypothetical protein
MYDPNLGFDPDKQYGTNIRNTLAANPNADISGDISEVLKKVKSPNFLDAAQPTYDFLKSIGYNQAGNKIIQPYVNPYEKQINETLSNLQNRQPFQYDSNADQALQQDITNTTGQIEKSTSESFAKRGMLYSDATKQNITQETAKAATSLTAQYRNIAYGQYQDENARLMDMANLVMDLDDQSFERYKQMVDQDYNERAFQLDQQQQAINNKRTQIQDAWDRVSAVGYVDNETSAILGIAVGTLSYEARKAIDDQNFELQRMEKDLEQWKQKTAIQKQDEIDLIQEREAMGTPEQMQNYYKYLDAFSANEAYADPTEAYRGAVSRRQMIEPFTGTKLYNQLLNDLQNLAATQPKEAEDPTLGAIYSEMMNAKDPGEWLKNESQYMTDPEIQQAIKWLEQMTGE